MSNYQVMPDLSPEDYAELKSDIAVRGVQVPVEYDEADNILDGHHRVKACKELGVTDWPRVVRVGMTEEQKREHARKLNMARRHLTREQRQELIRQQLRETPEKSDRQIAQGLGVDHKTVGYQRNELIGIGEIPQCDRQTSDGRTYPAQRRELEAASEIPKLDRLTGADGKTYPRQVERKTPCDQCKSAHPHCDDCCEKCVNRCNGAQACYLPQLSRPITIFEPTESKIDQAKELLKTAAPELLDAVATGKVPLMQGYSVAVAADQHEQKEAVKRLDNGEASYLMDGLNQQRMEAHLNQTPVQRKEMEQRIRDGDKKIDREFALSALIHKMIDAVLKLRSEDVEEAVRYFVDHKNDIDFTVGELGECIERLQMIKVAFSKTKRLKVVK